MLAPGKSNLGSILIQPTLRSVQVVIVVQDSPKSQAQSSLCCDEGGGGGRVGGRGKGEEDGKGTGNNTGLQIGRSRSSTVQCREQQLVSYNICLIIEQFC